MSVATRADVTVRVPVWWAQQHDCATEMVGEIAAETAQAIRFRGRIPAIRRTHCLRCGRELTHPVSLIVGIGPFCAEKLGIDRSRYEVLPPEDVARLLGEIVVDLWIPKSVVTIDGQRPQPVAPAVDTAMQSAPNCELPVPAAAPAGQQSLVERTERVFNDVMPARMPGYEPRQPQVEMAKLVARGLETGQHVLAEAGTGTGKSYGVLIPAIEFSRDTGRPVIVSTGTIALQEQYIKTDIPSLRRILDEAFDAVLAKGKGNYVCRLRLDGELQQGSLLGGESELIQWARVTETGDVADFPGLPDPQEWNRINVDDTCPGRKCQFYHNCHYYAAKRRAEAANVIICNHHLFFADLQIKAETGGHGGVLPPAAAVIFDEAHHVESIARESLGRQATSFWVPAWLRNVRQLKLLIDPDDLAKAEKANDVLFAAIAQAMEEDKQSVPHVPGVLLDELREALSQICIAIDKQANHLPEEDQDRARKLIEQAVRFRELVTAAVESESSTPDDNTVIWAERTERRDGTHKVTLHITPIDVAGILREYLFSKTPVVMTSATIAVAGKFDHLRARLGIDQALELVVDSPFNYRERCMLYVPRPGEVPNAGGGNPEYHERIAPLIEDILRLTEGRAFVLFTSYRGMQVVYDLISHRLPWRVLKQGDAPRSQLVEEFRQDTHSVLFGTKTFWEGISIEGEALSAVIIDKLPFSVPSDPVTKAIAQAVEQQGRSPFFEISLPEAVLNIKQGFGRLIRTRQDRGIVAILDTRIRTKPYGRAFLVSLPRARRVERLEDIAQFMGQGRGAA